MTAKHEVIEARGAMKAVACGALFIGVPVRPTQSFDPFHHWL
jgi:hypothetical protein